MFLRIATAIFALMLCAGVASAQDLPADVLSTNDAILSTIPGADNLLNGIPALQMTTAADGSQQYTVSLQILFIMTALTLLPAMAMMMTSFTRIIVCDSASGTGSSADAI
jgi:flagellar biosynthetic protein FliP